MKTMATLESKKYFILSLIVVLSLALNVFFFNGSGGSDDIRYLERSLDVARWQWTSANYNGALRYGYNIPSGFLIALFGLNIFTANLWALICSLAEVSVVFLFAWKYLGYRTAIYSALLLAFMPLHVALSTRLHSDPVVCMFLTLSFIVFYKAERESGKQLYFLTGIVLGCVFWTKELLALAYACFLFHPVLIRKIKFEWGYLVLGGLTMLLAHFALMQFIAGDPFHAFKTILGQLKGDFIASSNGGVDEPWFYFRYLFINLKHTWITSLLIPFGVVAYWRLPSVEAKEALKYVAFWLISLLLVLSFFPFSINPVKFPMKQYNYLSLFLAPIALIAGAVISTLPRKIAYSIFLVILMGGFVLSAVEQQAYQLRTASSWGLLAFSESHPDKDIYGSVKNSQIASFNQVVNGKSRGSSKIHDFSQLPENLPKTPAVPVYAVIDRASLGHFAHDVKIGQPPACWREAGTITPATLGNSRYIIDSIIAAKAILPAKLVGKFEEMKVIAPTTIYEADLANLWCESDTAQNAVLH
jgi:4-amino-4-deoxy-L-arabinose transferase-like glycosyltransferase